MAVVLVLDQRSSRRSGDLVERGSDRLNHELGPTLARPFVRTAGDEMQAIAASQHAVYATTAFALREREWWMGVGLGAIDEPIGETASASRGSAFWAARVAIQNAKSGHKSPRGVAVVGDGEQCTRYAEELDAALNALAFILDSRTLRQWQVVDWARRGLSGAAIAEQLNVSPQRVSQLRRAAGIEEERRLAALIDHIARPAAGDLGGCSG